MTMSNPIVVPASKTKGLRIGITVVSPDQSQFEMQDALPADVLAFTSLSDPIFRSALRVRGRSACTDETRPSSF